MDFVSDTLFNGQRIRALTLVDDFTRECLAIYVDHSIKAVEVVGVMEVLNRFMERVPERIEVDNGAEFISHRPWSSRRMRRVWSLTSQGLGNPRIMGIYNNLTGVSGMNV